jgi:hypothetical protein
MWSPWSNVGQWVRKEPALTVSVTIAIACVAPELLLAPFIYGTLWAFGRSAQMLVQASNPSRPALSLREDRVNWHLDNSHH